MGRSLALSEIMDKGQCGHSGLIFSQDPYTMMHMVKMLVIEVMRNATSKVGQHLNLRLLGTLQPGAPADIISVKGDPSHCFKILEYPDLVMP